MFECHPTHILYVEDDRDLATLVRTQLSEAGYAVDVAHDGEEGLAKWATGSYHLLAVDHAIPVRNGLDVIRILASKGPLPPTIMITGSGDEEIAVETMKLGADDYIVKDTSGGWLHLLPTVIEQILAKRRLVHEKQRAEEELRKSEKRLVEAEKLAAVGRMAARVAHEINNPLAGIKNSFLLLKDAVPQDHPDHEFVGLAEKEIDRIARIIRQMIELYRPERESVRDVRVGETIHEVIVMLEPHCREHGVRVEVRTADPEMSARIPENSMRQVLYNLLANAIEASPPDGVVEITTDMVEGALKITVADQGMGIPAEAKDRVFEPFFTTKEAGVTGGMGLGLAISKGIVEALKGALDFESTPGKGTVFRLVLPSKVGETRGMLENPGCAPVGP